MENLLQHDRGDSVSVRLRSAQIHQLYSQSRFAAMGAVLGAFILAGSLWYSVPRAHILIWLVSYLIIHSVRQVLVIKFHQRSLFGEKAIPWDRWFTMGAVVGCLWWGLTAIFLFPSGYTEHQFLLAVCVTGIATAAAVSFAPTNCYLPCIFVCLVPLSSRFLYESGLDFKLSTARADAEIGLAVLFFSVILALLGKRMNSLISDSLRLRIGTEYLIGSLKEEKAAVEELNLAMKSEISLRQAAEKDLKAILGEMEARVEERTQKLEKVDDQLRRRIADVGRVHRELKSSEERFRAVFETAQDCIFIKDANMVYSHVNQALLTTFGLTQADIIGKTVDEVFGPSKSRYIKEMEKRVLAGHTIEAEHLVQRGKHRRIMRCSRVPLRDSSGKITGICGIARDITDEKPWKLEQRIRNSETASPLMRATMEEVLRVAQTDSIVLLLGESGSGKDHLARYLHEKSKRSIGSFFSINCAALPGDLAESELFGHEPGAFTGAHGRKRGLLELAEGGTILLNEIGELSPLLQAKLLTFLDTQSFTRLGGEKSVSVEARILAATNRDLAQEVEAGRFRSDLFYRVNVFAIKVPPLRQRSEDIPILAHELLEKISKKLGRQHPPAISSSAIERLSSYGWPGNVRELRNVLERALILTRANHITAKHIELHGTIKEESNETDLSVTLNISDGSSMTDAIEKAKIQLITEALQRSDGNVSAAARLLGVSREILRHHMKKI